MTEAFHPDPGGLRARMQGALGDRQIDQAPGYDPGQVLPVVLVAPQDTQPIPVKVIQSGGSAQWTAWSLDANGVFTPPADYPVENGDEFTCRAQHVPGGSDTNTYWGVQGRPGNPRVPWLPGTPTPAPTPSNPLGYMVTVGLQVASWPWIMSGRTEEWTGVVVVANSTNPAFFATRRITAGPPAFAGESP